MSVPRLALNWVICFSLAISCGMAQSPFAFTEVAPSAHANAAGGNLISYSKRDGLSFLQNPALLDSTLKNQLSVSYSPYFSGHYNSLSYVLPGKKSYTAGVFARALNFGKFVQTDDIGNVTGQFSVGNYDLGIGVAKSIERISFGANLRLVNSLFAGYWSSAVALDCGGTYMIPEKGIHLSLVARNIGFSLSRSPFIENQLPFNLLVGMSIKPQFMPARFHIVLDQLSDWSSENKEKLTSGRKAFSHLALGADIFFRENIYLTVSNNFGRSLNSNESHIFSGYGVGLTIDFKRASLGISNAANPLLKNQTVFSLAYKF